jgi:hypothetical protein
MARPIVIALPVKNEARHIAACLLALGEHQTIPASRIVLMLNDCTDGTSDIVRQLVPSLTVPVDILLHAFPPGLGSAGYARHLAMEHAAHGMRNHGTENGVLLTTDADSRVPPEWIAANLYHIRAGADAVAGRAVIDPVDARLIPQRLHDDDALECVYSDLLDEIATLVDPTPWDPWPRHTEHSGASIAVTWDAYRRAGGMPMTPLGEDREFFRALDCIDAKVRHAPDVAVVVSGRTQGRAAGGMADTIRRRLERPDAFLDDRLEPPADVLRRAHLRRSLRMAWLGGAETVEGLAPLANALALPAAQLRHVMASPAFGALWKQVEVMSPVLIRQRIPARLVHLAIARATTLRDRLRRPADLSTYAPEDPGGNLTVAAAALVRGHPTCTAGATRVRKAA